MGSDTIKLPEHQPSLDSFSLYEQHIGRGDTVIVVGPNGRIVDDPTLFATTHIVGGDGHVLIADPQYRYLEREEYTSAVEQAGSLVSGYGNVEEHLRELDALHALGVDMQMPEWLGPTSTAQNLRKLDGTPIPNETVDSIVDHGTSPFLVSAWGRVPPELQGLGQIYQEYARVLRPGGRLLLEVPLGRYQTSEGHELMWEQILHEAGFEVRAYSVPSLMRVTIDPHMAERIAASDSPVVNEIVLDDTLDRGAAIIGGDRGSSILFIAEKPRGIRKGSAVVPATPEHLR